MAKVMKAVSCKNNLQHPQIKKYAPVKKKTKWWLHTQGSSRATLMKPRDVLYRSYFINGNGDIIS
jgi:hypothetical protein